MRTILAIGSAKEKLRDLKQLPVFRIYETREGEYIFLERTVIEEAITHSLNKLKVGELSVVLIEVQIVPMSSRKRRVTKSRNNLRN